MENQTLSGSKVELVQDIATTIISIFGILGNTFVIFVVFNGTNQLRTSLSTIYLVNQSLLDLFASIFMILDHWSGRLIDSKKLNYYTLFWYCHFWFNGIQLFGFLIASTYNLVFLSIERLVSVKYPIVHKTISRRKAIGTAVLLWLIFLPYQFIYQSTSTIIVNGTCQSFSRWPNDITRQAVGVSLIAFQFILPITIICYCYASIGYIFWKNSLLKDNDKKKIKNISRIKNTIKTFAIVAAAFIICWIWNQVYFIAFHLGLVKGLGGTFHLFSVFMIFINCCINPIIYTFRYEEFRKKLRRNKLFRLFNRKIQDENDSSATTVSN